MPCRAVPHHDDATPFHPHARDHKPTTTLCYVMIHHHRRRKRCNSRRTHFIYNRTRRQNKQRRVKREGRVRERGRRQHPTLYTLRGTYYYKSSTYYTVTRNLVPLGTHTHTCTHAHSTGPTRTNERTNERTNKQRVGWLDTRIILFILFFILFSPSMIFII